MLALYARALRGELKQDLAAEAGVDPHTISRRFKKLEASVPSLSSHDVQKPGEGLAWT